MMSVLIVRENYLFSCSYELQERRKEKGTKIEIKRDKKKKEMEKNEKNKKKT